MQSGAVFEHVESGHELDVDALCLPAICGKALGSGSQRCYKMNRLKRLLIHELEAQLRASQGLFRTGSRRAGSARRIAAGLICLWIRNLQC